MTDTNTIATIFGGIEKEQVYKRLEFCNFGHFIIRIDDAEAGGPSQGGEMYFKVNFTILATVGDGNHKQRPGDRVCTRMAYPVANLKKKSMFLKDAKLFFAGLCNMEPEEIDISYINDAVEHDPVTGEQGISGMFVEVTVTPQGEKNFPKFRVVRGLAAAEIPDLVPESAIDNFLGGSAKLDKLIEQEAEATAEAE